LKLCLTVIGSIKQQNPHTQRLLNSPKWQCHKMNLRAAG
jgi:hypothetical protein